jgi:type III restriction enzyme
MTAQFQYRRLAYQAQAVNAIFEVFTDVRFIPPRSIHANPTYEPNESCPTLRANILRLQKENRISVGKINVQATATPALSLDILMETGTGKTFTFIESIHRLHQTYGLSKFIVLVPSNAIRQGTLKTLQSTADFFAKEYNNQKINVFNYSDKAVKGFIYAANRGITVMVSTYQSFAGDSKIINKRAIEANLLGPAKSYMEALAAIRPVLIIDEPHRFDGKVVQEYLPKFNPLFTLRFGATFKRDAFTNLIYTLDSLEAFRQRLVKGITVDSIGTGADTAQTLCLQHITGGAKERTAHVSYQTASGKSATVPLHTKDNLGEKTGLPYLDGYVVESITTKELLFTNRFTLPIGEATACGMLADEVQSQLIQRTIANHFEREQALFSRGIKAISLFFIDTVSKYLPEAQRPAVIRTTFEHHYRTQLAQTLARHDLDPDYRTYLERTANDISRVHKGYFARSHSEKGEEEAIKLILQDKEKLLSFNTDLRFIFSMWALQEGWDNPNVFTLCKLAPSHSKISKLQQIGRGLRLAVNQQLERVQPDDAEFDQINDLIVVVPASEGDFVRAIQTEITAHSVRRVAAIFDDAVLTEFGVAVSTRQANKVLDALETLKIIHLDDTTGHATLLWTRIEYQNQRDRIVQSLLPIPGMRPEQVDNMLRYLDTYYEGAGQVKSKRQVQPGMLTINPSQYQKLKDLWNNLNRDAVLIYDLDNQALVNRVVETIEKIFDIRPLSISVTRTTDVQSVHRAQSSERDYTILAHSVYTLGQFVRELANLTRLSIHTISQILHQMPAEKFAQIKHNEIRALQTLSQIIQHSIVQLVVNTIHYNIKEIRIKTALTDATGALIPNIPTNLCGTELHPIHNDAIRQRSLYQEAVMPVDSTIERTTVDESRLDQITVFAKLPKINIPTPLGNYNPDFAYVIQQHGQAQALYMVVETKGYNSPLDIPKRESLKMDSAERFFAALQAQTGNTVHFQRKINSDTLRQILQQINPAMTNPTP